MKKVFLLLALASMIVACVGSSKNDGAPKSTVAMVDTLASSSDSLNLAKPEATKPVTQPNNEIWYTSFDGKVVKPREEGKGIFGAEIESNTYKNGKGIIKFKDDVTTIGAIAFRGCTNLTSVTIPDSVTTIGDSAFNGCKSLSSITIPDSVTTIVGSAFMGCTNLTSIIIPNSVTTIGDGAFVDCDSLNELRVSLRRRMADV